MEEKIKAFKKIIELATELNVDLNREKNYLYAYMCLMEGIRLGNAPREYTEKEIAEMVGRTIDIFLDTTEDYMCPIDEITDYLLENYDDLDDETTNYDILEDIIC